MNRTTVLAAVTSALALTIGLAPASTATAAPGCTATIAPPARAAIAGATSSIAVPLSTTCTDGEYADWEVVGPKGLDDYMIYEPATNGAVSQWVLYSGETYPGVYRFTEGFAFDTNLDEIPTNEAATEVKYGARSGLRAARSGSTLTLTATASYLNYAKNAFVARGNAKVVFQVLGTNGQWQYLSTRYTNASGAVAVKVNAPSTRTYRAYVVGTASVWETATKGLAA